MIWGVVLFLSVLGNDLSFETITSSILLTMYWKYFLERKSQKTLKYYFKILKILLSSHGYLISV